MGTTMRESTGFIGSLIRIAPIHQQLYMFAFIQFVYTFLTMAVCPLFYYSSTLHFLWLFLLVSWSARNGSCFYVDVFAPRYQREMRQLELRSQFVEPVASSRGSK